jgi:iron complex outermembrane recepter protein
MNARRGYWRRKLATAAISATGVASLISAGEPTTAVPAPPPAAGAATDIQLVRQPPGAPALNQPNLPQPNLPQPNLPQPNIPQPNVPQPNLPQPNVPQPNLPSPGVGGQAPQDLMAPPATSGSNAAGASSAQPTSFTPPAPAQSNVAGGQAAQAVNANDIAQLLTKSTQSTGVELQRRNALISDPRVRGYHVGQFDTYGDGGFFFPARQDIDTAVGKFDPSSVRGVEVIKGPYSARLGPGFAFIDINSFDSPRFDCLQVHGRSNTGYQSNGNQMSALQSVSVGNVDWGVRVTYNLLTGNEYHDGQGDPIAAGYKAQNTTFAMGVDLTENAHLEFKGLRVYQKDLQLPSLYFDISRLDTEAYSARFTLDNQPWFSRFELTGWYNYTVANGNTLDGTKQAFLDRFLSTTFGTPVTRPIAASPFPQTLTTGFNPGVLIFDASDTNFGESSIGYRTALTWGELKPNKAQLTVGNDLILYGQGLVENIRLVQQGVPGQVLTPFTQTVGPIGGAIGPNGVPVAGNRLLFAENSGIPNSNSVDPGLFIEGSLPVNDRWTLKAGGRVDFVHMSSDPRQIVGNIDLFGFPVQPGVTGPRTTLDPIVYASRPDANLSRDFNLAMGFVNGEFKVDEHLTALAGFGYAQRAPTLTELYATAPFVSVLQQGLNRLIGDPNLSPEKLMQLDVGLTANYDRFRGGVNAFYAWIHDYITYDQNVGGTGISQVVFTNTDLATLAGGEVYAQVDATDWLTPFATMSYVQGQDWTHIDKRRPAFLVSSRSSIATEPLPGIPPLELRWGFRVHEPTRAPKWMVEFIGRSVMGQNQVAASLGEQPTPGFTTLTVRGFWQVTQNVLLVAGVENINDKFYREHLDPTAGNFFGDPLYRPGTNYYVSTQVTY